MNIQVLTAGKKVIVRPDTTWVRNSDDFFPPEFVDSISFTPVLFAEVSKLGRSVSEKFADRYLEPTFGFGILLYPDSLEDGSPEGFACASCLDRTSYLTHPVLVPVSPESSFELFKGDECIYASDPVDTAILKKATEDISRFCRIRRGDLIAVELAPRKPLCQRAEGEIRIHSEAGINFSIIY